MKISFFLVFLIPFAAFSQDRNAWMTRQEEDMFLTRLAEFIPDEEQYVYQNFTEGRVFYVPHKESNPVKLNYNRLLKQMQMITENGDTIFVANFEIIKYILIDKDLYYHDFKKGYFQVLTNPDDSIRLVAQQWLNVKTRDPLGDSDHPQPIFNKDFFAVVYYPHNPALSRQWVKLSRGISFFLIDRTEEIQMTSKATFMKAFPKHKQEIEDYLKLKDQQNASINFHQEEDLKKLLQFCLSLS